MRLQQEGTERERGVITKDRQSTEKPRRWKVLLHNDDYTTMDFVVRVLVEYFHRTHSEATHIMLQIHHRGAGVAGVYPRDVAETKVVDVMRAAREEGHPLLLTTEPAE